MLSCFRRLRAVCFAVPLLTFASLASPAYAADGGTNPCGTFDFSGGVSCKIAVAAACKADCTSLKVEAACSGHCGATADTTCTNNCGTQCVAQCDPAHLDCFVGCHNECDQPTIDKCQANHSSSDCVNEAKAHCDMHCKDACKVPSNNCSEHCNRCCTGSCTTQVNFDCDLNCFADVKGGCNVQCDQPTGAIYCNGQYVHASDVEACISYLATQGVNVDLSARGSVQCDLTHCDTSGPLIGKNAPDGSSTAKGCAFSPAGESSLGIAASFFGLALGAIVRRRRRG